MEVEHVLELFDCLYDGIQTEADFPLFRPLLAHYTSLASLERILATDELWFSNPLLMNDLDEVRFGVTRGVELVNSSPDLARACGTSARTNRLRNAYQNCFRRFEAEQAFDTYVFCLSEHAPDDYDGPLSMWRGYGGNGNGVAIVFDTKHIQAAEGSPLIVSRVHYGSNDDRVNWLRSTVERCAAVLRDNSIADDELPIAAYALFERIKVFALFSKHRGFIEEREWRVVYDPHRDTDGRFTPMLHYSIGPKGAEPKLRFKVGPVDAVTGHELSLTKIVERIILGPTASSQLAQKTIHRMLDAQGKSFLKPRVFASRIPFRHR